MIVDINDFKSAIESANLSVDKLKEDFKHQLDFELNIYLHKIVNIVFDKFPLLNRFAIVGSTPEWNDGEELVHSSDIFFGNEEWYEHYRGGYFLSLVEYAEEELYEFFSDGVDGIESTKKFKPDLPNSKFHKACKAKEMKELTSMVKQIDKFIESVKVTNYLYKFTRQEGVHKIEYEEFNIGY